MTTMLANTDQMYEALVRRDPACDGVFFVGVKTTGVFCRPTCPARKPRPENVEYFSAPRAALVAGYRPCLKCRPLDNGQAAPEWVHGLLARVEQAPADRITSQDLRRMSIEPARAARWFKQHYGMTFQAYHRARRMGLALKDVRAGRDATQTALRSGFESASGFRSAFNRMFGTTPGQTSDLACLIARWLDTPLGALIAIANDEGLCLLEFVDRRMLATQFEVLQRRFNASIVPGDNDHLRSIAREIAAYFTGDLRQFKTPMVLRGTDFQVRVWKRLMEIPYGETGSYAQMARDLKEAKAMRAVGRANGDNRLAIIIPCHRVIRADGTLCGYGGGLWRKQWLLEHERRFLR